MPRRVPANPEKIETPPPPPATSPAGRGSGFHYTQLGPLVEHDPAAAAVILRAKLRATGGNASEVARQERVAYKTITRWIRTLAEKGHDPREQRVAAG